MKARPQKNAGPSGPPLRSSASSGACTTSRIDVAEAEERLPRRARRRRLLADAAQVEPGRLAAPATVRSSAGVIATTWSSAVTPLGWTAGRGRRAAGGAQRRRRACVGSPSSSLARDPAQRPADEPTSGVAARQPDPHAADAADVLLDREPERCPRRGLVGDRQLVDAHVRHPPDANARADSAALQQRDALDVRRLREHVDGA